MTLRDVGRKQESARRPPASGSAEQHARQREREPRRRMRAVCRRGRGPPAAIRDGETQPRAFALVGVVLEGVQGEIVLRRDLLQAARRSSPRVGRAAGRRRRSPQRSASVTGSPAASSRARRAATSRHQASRIAARLGSRARKRAWPDLDSRSSRAPAARRGRAGRRIERAEPLIAGMFARERGAIYGRPPARQRRTGRRGHGAAISAAATRRPSDRMTL